MRRALVRAFITVAACGVCLLSAVNPRLSEHVPTSSESTASTQTTRPHYRSPGKPGAEIHLVSAAIHRIPLGAIETLQLELASQLPKGSLQINVEPSEGLTLIDAKNEWHFTIDNSQNLSLPIHVRADQEGQHYVHLFVQHNAEDGAYAARALASEIRVGDMDFEPVYAKSFKGDKASEVRSLPAQETIF